ncbi:MAG: oligosaccharide flippase family protein, partial [Pseudomonadota bacterium]
TAIILVEVLMARGLGTEAYGIFATTHAFTILAILVFDLGSTAWTIQEGSRHPKQLAALFGNSLLLKTTAFAVLYAVLLFMLPFTSLDSEIRVFVAVFALYGFGLALVDSLASVYTASQEMHINALFQALSPLAILCVYLVVSLDGRSLLDAALAFVIGSVSIGMIWLAWTWRNRLRPAARVREALSLARQSYHYGISSVLRQVYYKTDIVMVAFLVGAAEAGVFAAALKFLDFFYKIPLLLSRVVSPALFAESRTSDPNQSYETLVSIYSRYLVVLGAFAALVTYLSADTLVELAFGDAYASSGSILRILSMVMVLKCMMIVCEGVLSSLGAHTVRWASFATTVVINIVLNLILVPRYGAEGAAIATVLSGALLVGQFVVLGFGRRRVLSALAWFGLPSLATIAIAAAVGLVSVPFPLDVLAAVAVLAIALIASGVVRLSELQRFGAAALGKAAPTE